MSFDIVGPTLASRARVHGQLCTDLPTNRQDRWGLAVDRLQPAARPAGAGLGQGYQTAPSRHLGCRAAQGAELVQWDDRDDDLGFDAVVEVDGDAVFAHGLDRLAHGDLVAIDLDALLRQQLGDLAICH